MKTFAMTMTSLLILIGAVGPMSRGELLAATRLTGITSNRLTRSV